MAKMIYHSFGELAAAFGGKIHVSGVKTEAPRKCPKCGDPMKHIAGTNVYLCEHVDLVDEELKGESVQVIRKCGNRVFA